MQHEYLRVSHPECRAGDGDSFSAPHQARFGRAILPAL